MLSLAEQRITGEGSEPYTSRPCHQRCYLRSTNNCCHTITSEHSVSQSVLHAMARGSALIEMGGLHWKAPGELAQLHINNLGSNILCKRHNSALSPLDAAAGGFFRIL
jgi:hypothetical protein